MFNTLPSSVINAVSKVKTHLNNGAQLDEVMFVLKEKVVNHVSLYEDYCAL